MKKILSIALVLVLALFCFAACGTETQEPDKNDDVMTKSEGVNTHAEYVAAKKGDKLVIEAFVQGKQAWWSDNGQGKASIYAQDNDGGYFFYELHCTEEEYNKLATGTKIRVTGYKTEWAGEMEIDSGATLEILEGTYVAPAFDVTSIIANEAELIKHQNEFTVVKGVTLQGIEYKGGSRGNDIYVTVAYGDGVYSFCVESYLTDADSAAYKAVEALKPGDVIDVEGFLYWYEGVNTHITKVSKSAFDPAVKGEGVNTHAEYEAAAKGDELVIEAYVQGKQAWWSDEGQGKASIYAQDKDGGYFLYELLCTEEEYNKLVKGSKIKVTGYKTEWAGEMEIDAEATFELLEGNYVAPAVDVTDILNDEGKLIKHQNEFATIKGLTFVALEYKGGSRGNDIYVTFSLDGAEYSFCVESYLTDADSDTYKAVEALVAGDVVDVEGFLYWYEGVNTHITSVTKK